jgi:predicted secreted protein
MAFKGRDILIKTSFTATELVAPSVEYNVEVAADSPDHWWHLGEPSGNFADSGALNLPLTVLSNGAGSSVTRNVTDLVEHITPSEVDGALEFNQVDRANGTWLQNSSGIGALTWPLTIEFWFVLKPFLATMAATTLISTHELINTNYKGFFVGVRRPEAGADIYLRYGSGLGSGYNSALYARTFDSSGLVSLSYDGTTLYHLVARFIDPDNASIVLNGVPYNLIDLGNAATTVSTPAGIPFNICRDDSSNVVNQENYGHLRMDEVAIYKNRALSDARALAHYNAGAYYYKDVSYIDQVVGGLRSKNIVIERESVDISADQDVFRKLQDNNAGEVFVVMDGSAVFIDDVAMNYFEDASINGTTVEATLEINNDKSFSGSWLVTTFERSIEMNDALACTLTLDGSVQTYTRNSYIEEVQADSPNHWWRLGDDAGLTLVDSVGGLHLTLIDDGAGSHSLNAPDLVVHREGGDGCLRLNAGGIGVGSRGVGGYIGALSYPITFEAWGKSDTFNPGNGAFAIFSTHERIDIAYSGFHVSWNLLGSITMYYGDGLGFGETHRRAYSSAAGVVDLTAIHHIVAIFPDNLTALCWLDGVQIPMSYAIGSALSAWVASGNMTLGANDASAAGGTYYHADGWLDECAIYKGVALSEERILAHYNAGKA